jgi:hypothetical protein
MFFIGLKKLGRLEDAMERLEGQQRRLKEDWAEVLDKLERLMWRTEKRKQRLVDQAGPDAAASSSATERPDLAHLDPISRRLIMERETRFGQTPPGANGG